MWRFFVNARNARTKAKVDAEALASARSEAARLQALVEAKDAALGAREKALCECRAMVASLAASLDTRRGS